MAHYHYAQYIFVEKVLSIPQSESGLQHLINPLISRCEELKLLHYHHVQCNKKGPKMAYLQIQAIWCHFLCDVEMKVPIARVSTLFKE